MSFIRRYKKGGSVYLAEVENKWVDGKVVQKYIRHLGKEVDGESVISLSSKDIQMESVKVYGPLLALHSIAKKIGLPKILGEFSNEILSMTYAHCINYKSLRDMPGWYKRTDLNLMLNLEELTEGRLVSALDFINDDRIEIYQRRIFENVKKRYRLKTEATVYDTTNTYFHGRGCPMGRVGRSKDGKKQNDLIQIALVTTQKEGIPIFHKTFAGNIHDARTLSDILSSLLENEVTPGLLVYDRGIVSKKNLLLPREMGIDVLCGLPMKEREKAAIRKYLRKSAVSGISNMVKVNRNTFYAVGVPHTFSSVKGRLVICLNESRRRESMESRRAKILEAQELRRKKKKISDDMEMYLTPTGRIRENVLKQEEELDGYTCIFSMRRSIPPKEMVRLYFDKDVIEKAFRTLKGVTNVRPVRFWLGNRVKAHVFICYLSYLLLSVLKMDLKSKNIEMSELEAMRELETMYNVYFSDKKKKITLTKTVALSKQQEKILRSIDAKILRNHVL